MADDQIDRLRKWRYLKRKVFGIAWGDRDWRVKELIEELIDEAEFLLQPPEEG